MPRRKHEFKPDAHASVLKGLYITRLQRKNLLKWCIYSVICVLLLVVQDVVMSRVRIFGATTDLAPMIVLLLTVLVGTDAGSMFAVIASTVYYLSGSAPGAYVIALLTVLGIFAAMIRQIYWRHGLRSTVLCAGIALILYEIVIFAIGWVSGLTLLTRLHAFIFSGLISWALMIPLFPLLYWIGKIGGEPWKE